MASDVARLIIEYLNSDKSLDGLELKEMFKKKIKIDADHVREKLKRLVSNHIANNVQPVHNTLVLHSDIIMGGGNVQFDEFSIASTPPGRVGELQKDVCTLKAAFNYITIKNPESRKLIQDAIVPLDLKWTVEYKKEYKCYVLIVNWAHWHDE